ncbi:uncharacterized protein AKAME5_000246900 [Lates japonicus]|uniref:Uncharacterized protein n=1 Tax=Lates japonicus TaxID=270547 RepID=A0AAD3M6P7_LATJO|nr:uncharacterized protein AKAME5_000246900 [Lates japonicus]
MFLFFDLAATKNGSENSLDVGQHTALSNSNSAEQLVQLLIVRQLQVTGMILVFLFVSGSVFSQLWDLSGQVLQAQPPDRRELQRRRAQRIVALSRQPMNAANGELESGTEERVLALSSGFSTSTRRSYHVKTFLLFLVVIYL